MQFFVSSCVCHKNVPAIRLMRHDFGSASIQIFKNGIPKMGVRVSIIGTNGINMNNRTKKTLYA